MAYTTYNTGSHFFVLYSAGFLKYLFVIVLFMQIVHISAIVYNMEID